MGPAYAIFMVCTVGEVSAVGKATGLLAAALVSVVCAAGCGGGDSKKAPTGNADQLAKQARTTTITAEETPPAAKTATGNVTVPVPKGWATPTPLDAPHIWPKALRVAASFPIKHLPANAACPRALLSSMPQDGIYILVAEYTKPRPPGFPAPRQFGPRPDLTQLDIRPAEVECWEGLGGSAEFTEKGRSFRVQILLGAQVTPAKRRQALEALNSLKVG